MRNICIERLERRTMMAGGLAAQSFLPIRINAGGDAVVDELQRTFVADRGFVGGDTRTWTETVFAANTPEIDARVGSDFQFSQRLPRGTYTVIVEVADPLSSAAGQRVFDVFAEGSVVIDDIDARSRYRANTATEIAFRSMSFAAVVTVNDGRLDLRFLGVAGEALVSAVTIYSNATPAEVLPYEQTARAVNGQPYEAAINVQDASRLREVGLDLMLFANAHRGQTPWSWQDMAMEGTPDANRVTSAWRTHGTPRGLMSDDEIVAFAATRSDFVVLGWQKRFRDIDAGAILGYRNLSLPGNEIPVLRGDGSVHLMTRAALLAELGTTSPRIDKNLGELSTQPLDPDMLLIRSRLSTLGNALQRYRSSNSFNLPVSLGQLYARNFVRDVNVYLNPRFPVEVPTGLSVDEMAAWIDQNAGYRYNRLTRTGANRDNVVTVFEDPRRVHGPVWMLNTEGIVRLHEPMWADELLQRTSAYLWQPPPAELSAIVSARKRTTMRAIDLIAQ